jgi:alpha-ketoglutarate-dependent taurine dioxygenase
MSEVVAFTKSTDREKIVKLLKDVGIVVMRDHGMSLSQYNNFLLDVGYHQHPKVWCAYKEFPIFWRVNNQAVDEHGHKGLFGKHDIDWHSNILYTQDSHEVVSIYGHKIPIDQKECSPTTYSNTIPYFKTLPKDLQKRYKTLYTKWTYDENKTFEKRAINLHRAGTGLALAGKAAKDTLEHNLNHQINENAKTQSIHNAVNFDPANSHLYKKGRYQFEGYNRLSPRHPIGAVGLFFNYINIENIVDENYNPVDDALEIYNKLKQDLLIDTKYHYIHEWQETDIVIADQLTGVHRRDHGVPDHVERELLRATFWYKTQDRVHYDYSL